MLISLHLAETLQYIVCVRQSTKCRKSDAVQEHGHLNIINFPTLLCVFFLINGASIELKMEMFECSLSSANLSNNPLKTMEVTDVFHWEFWGAFRNRSIFVCCHPLYVKRSKELKVFIALYITVYFVIQSQQTKPAGYAVFKDKNP